MVSAEPQPDESRGSAGACRTVRAPEPCLGQGCPAEPAEERFARLARGCKPRGCRAPARRARGRRVRYVIGDEPGQVNGMRWRGGEAPRRTDITRAHL
ncbi:tryptophan biosynthesis modulator TrpM [Streptomyces chilikensis]|uniref:tryptophan biosynthesis modulator TrpM n=1 Tax=Streptomyces chilikensis TaxID=1194079 RepID=UPI003F4D3AAE